MNSLTTILLPALINIIIDYDKDTDSYDKLVTQFKFAVNDVVDIIEYDYNFSPQFPHESKELIFDHLFERSILYHDYIHFMTFNFRREYA